MAVGIDDVPEHLLHRILLTATTHDDLIGHVAICAAVCRDWCQIVQSSPAWGSTLPRGRPESPGSRAGSARSEESEESEER